MWFKANLLTLSVEKTNFSIFHRFRKKIPDDCNSLKFHNQVIKRSSHVKYLGVILDDTLSWSDHISYLSEKLVKIVSSFKIIKHYVPEKCKIQLFHAYVNSRLKYGLEVYGHCTKCNLQRLQTLQNKSLKTLFNLDWYTPTSDLHKNFRVLKLVDSFRHSLLQLVFCQRNGMLPTIFDEYFSLKCDVHSIVTRQANMYNIFRAKSRNGNNTLRYTGAKLFNELPLNLIKISSFGEFKKKLKYYYLEMY